MYDFGEEEAVLLMDNCSPHLAPAVLTLLSNARVRIVTFAPNTTQIFQILDLTVFGVFKRREQYQLPFDDERATMHFIRKVYHDFITRELDPGLEIEVTATYQMGCTG
jgi:hypothetical protein